MSAKKTQHDDIQFMCTDSEKQIAKLEWLYAYRRPADPTTSQELKTLIHTMRDIHRSLEQMYEIAIGKKFEPKIDQYREKLRKKLSN